MSPQALNEAILKSVTGSSEDELEAVAKLADTFEPDSKIRSVLTTAIGLWVAGHDVCVTPMGHDLTPRQASELLGLSRPHLYKLMDKGLIPWRPKSPGSKHRLLDLHDVLGYQRSLENLRKSHAENLAQFDATESELIREASGLTPEEAAEVGL